jgi:hypothetical protein
LTIRRSADAAGVLRGLADPARQTGEWRTLAERWYRLWADEVGRELGGRRDEFDRWLGGERLPEATCESLRSRLHAELGARLSQSERARFSDLCFTDNGSYFRRSMTQRTWFLGHWQAIILGFSGLNR